MIAILKTTGEICFASTPRDAQDEADSGSLIVVGPGYYPQAESLGRHLVNWLWLAGSKADNSLSENGCPVFATDQSGCSYSIRGDGVFENVKTGQSALLVDHSAAHLDVTCQSLLTTGSESVGVYVNNGSLDLTAFLVTGSQYDAIILGGVGDCVLNLNRVISTGGDESANAFELAGTGTYRIRCQEARSAGKALLVTGNGPTVIYEGGTLESTDEDAVYVDAGELTILSGLLSSNASFKDLNRQGGSLSIGPAVIGSGSNGTFKTTGSINYLRTAA